MWGLLFDCMSEWRSGERIEHVVLEWDGVDGWLWLARKGCVCCLQLGRCERHGGIASEEQLEDKWSSI